MCIHCIESSKNNSLIKDINKREQMQYKKVLITQDWNLDNHLLITQPFIDVRGTRDQFVQLPDFPFLPSASTDKKEYALKTVQWPTGCPLLIRVSLKCQIQMKHQHKLIKRPLFNSENLSENNNLPHELIQLKLVMFSNILRMNVHIHGISRKMSPLISKQFGNA